MSRVIYRVSEDNALLIHYDAVTDAPTVVNFTSHVFFNLAGHAQVDAQSLGAARVDDQRRFLHAVGAGPGSHRHDRARGGHAVRLSRGRAPSAIASMKPSATTNRMSVTTTTG